MWFKLLKPYSGKIEKLEKFKQKLELYRRLGSRIGLTDQERQQRAKIREYLNKNLIEISTIIHNCGLTTEVFYQPPPAVGGRASYVDILDNIFHLHLYQMSFTQVLDLIDISIGKYESMQKTFWYKCLLNPFYWIAQIINLPFKIISFAGFNGVKFEFSLLGKIYKLIAGFLALIAGLWAVVQILEYIGVHVKDYINTLN